MFAVLHVCLGNICRSPMAERLLSLAASDLVGVDLAATLLYSHSAGTAGWHAGDQMNPPAASQLRDRGGVATDFRARRLLAEHVDGSDLILTATGEQSDYVVGLRPDATSRTFVLGQFGRLLPSVDLDALPAAGTDPDHVRARGVALVAAVDKVRAGSAPLADDDLDDPWGRTDSYFRRVADEIEATVRPLAAAVLR
jgi:protein-tyrosine phosphatase